MVVYVCFCFCSEEVVGDCCEGVFGFGDVGDGGIGCVDYCVYFFEVLVEFDFGEEVDVGVVV